MFYYNPILLSHYRCQEAHFANVCFFIQKMFSLNMQTQNSPFPPNHQLILHPLLTFLYHPSVTM